MKQKDFFYKEKLAYVEANCKREAAQKTAGKAEDLVAITPEDWYEFNGSDNYTGFASYAYSEEVACLKKSLRPNGQ